MSESIPGSVRVPTGEGNEYRYHAIQEAREFYGVNQAGSVAYACDNVTSLVKAIERILSRDDLTPEQKREIAKQCSSRGLSFDVETSVEVTQG